MPTFRTTMTKCYDLSRLRRLFDDNKLQQHFYVDVPSLLRLSMIKSSLRVHRSSSQIALKFFFYFFRTGHPHLVVTTTFTEVMKKHVHQKQVIVRKSKTEAPSAFLELKKR